MKTITILPYIILIADKEKFYYSIPNHGNIYFMFLEA